VSVIAALGSSTTAKLACFILHLVSGQLPPQPDNVPTMPIKTTAKTTVFKNSERLIFFLPKYHILYLMYDSQQYKNKPPFCKRY
jgi:hypothetical protein